MGCIDKRRFFPDEKLQFGHSGENGVWFHAEDCVHFSCHAETALVADATAQVIYALWRTASIAVDEVADPAVAFEI